MVTNGYYNITDVGEVMKAANYLSLERPNIEMFQPSLDPMDVQMCKVC